MQRQIPTWAAAVGAYGAAYVLWQVVLGVLVLIVLAGGLGNLPDFARVLLMFLGFAGAALAVTVALFSPVRMRSRRISRVMLLAVPLNVLAAATLALLEGVLFEVAGGHLLMPWAGLGLGGACYLAATKRRAPRAWVAAASVAGGLFGAAVPLTLASVGKVTPALEVWVVGTVVGAPLLAFNALLGAIASAISPRAEDG